MFLKVEKGADRKGVKAVPGQQNGWANRPGERDNPNVAYDEDLANRLRELLADETAVTEQRMFGGLAFLIAGNMAVSVSGRGGLLLRCDPAETATLLGKPHAATFEMRGRAMEGWLRVEPEGLSTKRQLERWVTRGVRYARSLPVKRQR
jgi:TfoX/Sxy family transcriptional regulator of competence genes